MTRNNDWDDDEIVNDSRIDHLDLRVRAGAVFQHANESLHRHDPRGIVCVYCALAASNIIRAADRVVMFDHRALIDGLTGYPDPGAATGTPGSGPSSGDSPAGTAAGCAAG